MKIAIITSCFLPIIDGVTVSGFQRLKRLSKWGHEVILFCPDYSSLKADYPNWQDYTGDILPGVKVINLASNSFVGLDYEPNVNRNSYQTVLKKLAEFQPDVIHVDEPERLYVGFWRLAGVNYAKKVGIPCVSFFRTNFLDYLGDYFPLPQPILALIKFLLKQLIVWVYNSYDLTLVTSKITYPKIVDLGIKNARYGNLVGFDTESFQDSLCQTDFFQSQYGLSQVDPLVKVVFLGRLYPDKGWDFTLDAFKTVSQQIDLTKVAIIVAGDGPMREEIRSKLKTLAPHVYLLGRISPENVPALLMNCDLHVTTSEKETRGLTILEAFAAGIPVIAPCSGGVVENIDDGNNGYLYSPGDRYNFTNKLKLLVENSALRQQMGERAKISVQGYSWDRSIQNLVNIWQEEIEQKSMIDEQEFLVNPEYN
ncbi:MAG: glycosyltransferase family 4 protein [Hyellaceae cyanobacterium CSU_1_1]|nr:glycosyltransferase family 4 protein [Hyellaceae cyanobacterium CSU_1_1]